MVDHVCLSVSLILFHQFDRLPRPKLLITNVVLGLREGALREGVELALEVETVHL